MKLAIMKDKWFFLPRDEAESRAFQEHMLGNGFNWGYPALNEYKEVPEGRAIGVNHTGEGRLGYADPLWYIERDHVQVYPDFATKVTVKDLNLPDVETLQEKRIRELEETITQATQQIELLKKGI